MKRLLLSIVALGAVAACGKKGGDGSNGPTPELTGLAAVPATAEDVVGFNVKKLLDSQLLLRAADQLFLRNSSLALDWAKIREACKLDLEKSVKRVMLALGPHAGTAPGTGPTLVIATGKLGESELSTCLRTIVGKGDGDVTAEPADKATIYSVGDATKKWFYAFGNADTVVSSSAKPYLLEALGSGKKAPDEPSLQKWVAMADQNAPIWWAGKVNERISQGLIRQSQGKVTHGPVGMVGSLDPTDGAKLEVKLGMASEEDAKQLESFAKTSLTQLAMAAQLYKLGGVVNKVEVAVEGSIVKLHVALTAEEVNQILSALDVGGGGVQDAPPSQGSN